jgi:hydrogenase maturation protease
MTVGSVETAPVLVLGLGNRLLSDDGVGPLLVDAMSGEGEAAAGVEFVDGGTQGLMLLSRIGGRTALLILDAVALGAPPGTVHVLDGPAVLESGSAAGTAHEANAGELLRAAALLGELPPRVAVVGIEPAELRTGVGLSEAVTGALPAALQTIREVLRDMLWNQEEKICVSQCQVGL